MDEFSSPEGRLLSKNFFLLLRWSCKSRLYSQVQTTRASIMLAVMKIWQQDDLLGFLRGNGLNIVKVAPESAIKFYAFEMLKNVIGDAQGNESDIGIAGRLFAGGKAGGIAQAAIYPLDLIKTRLQTLCL